MNVREIRAIANHGRGSQMTKALNELLDINEELVEALKGYDQIARITIKRLVRQYGNENDEYATELSECLDRACKAIAKAKGEE